jgi:hypothetical protein
MAEPDVTPASVATIAPVASAAMMPRVRNLVLVMSILCLQVGAATGASAHQVAPSYDRMRPPRVRTIHTICRGSAATRT